MKLLIILIILISFDIAIGAEMFFTNPISLCPGLTNTTIQNGSTPYLQKEVIEERRTPEINFTEELEKELIEIRTLQVCA